MTSLTMLPYYIAVAAVYGGLTWAANSILPALVLHVRGDVWSLGRQWMTGAAGMAVVDGAGCGLQRRHNTALPL